MAFENSGQTSSELAEMNAHPWITDPADLPSKLNWPETLLLPFGETSRLHFTRAWTGLFFVRLIVFAIPIALSVLLSVSGVNDPGFSAIPPWGFPLVVFATGLMSFVLHVRRLTNAKRSAFWSVLVILPIVAGGLGFVAGLSEGGRDYEIAIKADQLKEAGVNQKQMAIDFDRRDVYKTLSRDVIFRLFAVQVQSGETESALDKAIEDSQQPEAVQDALENIGVVLTPNQSESLAISLKRLSDRLSSSMRFSEFLKEINRSDLKEYRGSIENRWKSHMPVIDYKTVSQREHAISVAIGMFIFFWMIPSLIATIWSLTWVGRLPNGGGDIRDRFA
ncbi:MAG: hypothetical protein ABNH53_14470 [Henriciella sp.]|jgi:uncharacterized membrane protein YhaH (DUF805 family)